MAIGIVGKKAGMTRIFTEEGQSVAVTVVQVAPNRVTQVKNADSDGYSALQITFGEKKASRVNKAAAGHFAKANVQAGRGLMEFLTEEALSFWPPATQSLCHHRNQRKPSGSALLGSLSVLHFAGFVGPSGCQGVLGRFCQH